MMNNIYDFSETQKIRDQQKRIVLSYALLTLCFVIALTLTCFLVESNILITLIFALLLTFFLLFSIVFWRVRYGILNEHRAFLENMEMGIKKDYVGIFVCREEAAEDESFDRYIFAFSDKRTTLLIHKQYEVDFSVGEKYHTQYVGSYLYSWESI